MMFILTSCNTQQLCNQATHDGRPYRVTWQSGESCVYRFHHDTSTHRRFTRPIDSAQSIFPEVPLLYTRNYLITDTSYISPPVSGLGVPGPDGGNHGFGSEGLPDMPPSILATLSPESRAAYEDARAEQTRWKSAWRTEGEDKARAQLHITYNT